MISMQSSRSNSRVGKSLQYSVSDTVSAFIIRINALMMEAETVSETLNYTTILTRLIALEEFIAIQLFYKTD
jgi:hypothetical protein